MSDSIIIENIGENDKIPYIKADLVNVCRMGSEYAFSFYQFDYQSIAIVSKNGKNTPSADEFKDRLIPVAKIVRNELLKLDNLVIQQKGV